MSHGTNNLKLDNNQLYKKFILAEINFDNGLYRVEKNKREKSLGLVSDDVKSTKIIVKTKVLYSEKMTNDIVTEDEVDTLLSQVSINLTQNISFQPTNTLIRLIHPL
jgi:hypothetical protein